MKRARWVAGAMAAVMLLLTGCGTTVFLKSYPIEKPSQSYKRIRIGVPTAGAGAGDVYRGSANRSGIAALTVIDPQNIMAIVQNEVMKNLQSQGRKIALVDSNPDLDLQIAFQAPSPAAELISLLTLGFLKTYTSVGGAKLVDAKTGNVLFTYEFVTRVRAPIPPIKIQDWETFAKALAAEINKSLGQLQLADQGPHIINISAG